MIAALTHVAFATTTRRSGFAHATEDALARLPILLDGPAVVMHNAVYDLVVLARHGVSLLHAPVDCTRVLSYLVNEHNPHDLTSTTDRVLKHQGVLRFRDLPAVEAIGPEAHALVMAGKGRVDCEETLEVFEAMDAYLSERPMLLAAYRNIERPLVSVLVSMTLAGVPTDVARLQAHVAELERARAGTLEAIARWAGYRLDPDNDEAIRAWLYGTLGLPPAARTETGAPSVNREALAALSHPAAELVATARAQCSQIGAIRRWLDAVVSGRTHPTYSAWSRPTGAVTVSQPFGSAEDQGTPTFCAQQFVAAPEGKTLIVLQLQGARLRWLAHLSRDPMLVQAFTSGRPPAEVIADAMGITDATGRAAITAWLEALCAGDGPRAVAKAAGCRQKEAQAIGEQLRTALPAIFWLKRHLEEAGRRRGWVQTPLGRRRRFEPRYTAREALSEVLATAECDVFKLGLRRLWDLAGSRLVFAASRTAILEVDQAEAGELAREARRLLAQPCGGLPWPFDVGVWTVPRWSDAPPGGLALT
jgi:DNA polymerase-1